MPIYQGTVGTFVIIFVIIKGTYARTCLMVAFCAIKKHCQVVRHNHDKDSLGFMATSYNHAELILSWISKLRLANMFNDGLGRTSHGV